jgi:lipopolysaccharide export system permease protein
MAFRLGRKLKNNQMLRITTSYILSLLLWPTVLITFCLSGIIWLMQAVRFIDFIINRGLAVSDFLYLTMLLLPSLLTYILPISVVIAVIFLYHKLLSDSELIAIQASGFSRMQIARPAIIAATLITMLVYIFTLYLLPLSNREFKDIKQFLRDNYASVMLQEEVFNHPADGITVFIKKRNADGKLKGILVHDDRNSNVRITMMAEQATLIQTENGPKFLLENGIRQEMRDGKLSWLNFSEYNFDLSYYTKVNSNRVLEENELDTLELLHLAQAENPLKNHVIELHRRLTWPLLSIFLTIIAVGNLTAGEFKRRGLWKRLASTTIIVALCVIGFFFCINIMSGDAQSVLLLYGFIIALMLIGMLRFANLKINRKI